MMEKNIKIVLTVDKKTGAIQQVNTELGTTASNAKKASGQFEIMGVSLKKIVGYVGGVYALRAAFDAIIASGVDYNARLETMSIGIASLISVNSDNETSIGRVLTQQEKFIMAMASGTEVVAMLKKANLETSATLSQLTQGFQATVGPALKAGMSLRQTVEYTKLMTQAAGAMGVPMEQLAQEMRSVVSGTIDANSVVAKNIGITNAQIASARESGQLYEFLTKKLSGFAEAGKSVSGSFEGSVSNMEDAWDELSGELTRPIFDSAKSGAGVLAGVFNSLAKEIRSSRLEVERLQDVAKAKSIEDLELQISGIKEQLRNDHTNAITAGVSNFWEAAFGTSGGAEAKKQQLMAALNEAERKLERLQQKGQESLVVKPEELFDPNASETFSKEIAANNKYYSGLEQKSIEEAKAALLAYREELKQKAIDDAVAEGELQLQWFREQEEMAKRTSALMDQIWLASAGGFERKIYDIAQKWTALLKDIDDPTVLAQASESINKEIADATAGNSWFDGWTDVATQTLMTGIQNGLDGDFNFTNLMESFTSSLGNSFAQASLNAGMSNLAEGNAFGSGNLLGLAAGVGVMAVGSMISGGGETRSYAEIMLEKIEKELEKQTNLLNAQIGLYGSLGIKGQQLSAESTLASKQYAADLEKIIPIAISSLPGVNQLTSVLTIEDRGMSVLEALDWLYYDKGIGEAISAEKYKDAVDMVRAANDTYATSLLNLVQEVGSINTDLNQILIDLTGNDMLYVQQLQAARDEVEALIGAPLTEASYVKYLTNLVTTLDSFGTSVTSLQAQLISNDAYVQDQAIQQLEDVTGAYFDTTEQALNYLDSIQMVGKAYTDSVDNIDNAIARLDELWLGQYSPLSLLEKMAYANNVAYNGSLVGGQTALDAAFQRLQTTYATATTDEQLVPAFTAYAKLLAEQAEDATRQNIVDEIRKTNTAINELKDTVEDLQQAVGS